jgi:uncharacterized membrane protein YjdF
VGGTLQDFLRTSQNPFDPAHVFLQTGTGAIKAKLLQRYNIKQKLAKCLTLGQHNLKTQVATIPASGSRALKRPTIFT